MKTRDQIVLASVALLLLLTAWLIKEDGTWSRIGNYTVPWFCTATALALLLVLLIASLRGEAPSDIPWLVVAGTTLTVAGVLGVGTAVDHDKYSMSGIAGTRWEVAGFVVILLGMFLASRRWRSS